MGEESPPPLGASMEIKEIIEKLKPLMEAVGELGITEDIVLLEAYLSIKDAIAALEKKVG